MLGDAAVQEMEQESLADERVTRDSSACMKAPIYREEILAQPETSP